MFYLHSQYGSTVGTVAMLALTRVYGELDCFLSRVSILTRDIDIANLSVRPSVRYKMKTANYGHSFFTVR